MSVLAVEWSPREQCAATPSNGNSIATHRVHLTPSPSPLRFHPASSTPPNPARPSETLTSAPFAHVGWFVLHKMRRTILQSRVVLKEPGFFLLRTALKDRPKGPPTANRQLPPTANRQQPPTNEFLVRTPRDPPPPTCNPLFGAFEEGGGVGEVGGGSKMTPPLFWVENHESSSFVFILSRNSVTGSRLHVVCMGRSGTSADAVCALFSHVCYVGGFGDLGDPVLPTLRGVSGDVVTVYAF